MYTGHACITWLDGRTSGTWPSVPEQAATGKHALQDCPGPRRLHKPSVNYESVIAEQYTVSTSEEMGEVHDAWVSASTVASGEMNSSGVSGERLS